MKKTKEDIKVVTISGNSEEWGKLCSGLDRLETLFELKTANAVTTSEKRSAQEFLDIIKELNGLLFD